MSSISLAREIDSLKDTTFKFSICTLVSNKEEYGEMIDSFIQAGFDPAFCEFIYADNCNGNKYDAYAGINSFLNEAKGRYIILCHQDILLNHDKIDKLERCISELDIKFPNWGLIGNAGGVNLARNASKIATAKGKIYHEGPLPQEVQSLDENFIIVKREANIGASRDLRGFHLYGLDLCIHAHVLGYKAFIIDFLLTHKSYGNADQSFYDLKKIFLFKYSQVFAGRYIKTTITSLYLSGSTSLSYFANNKLVKRVAKFYHKFKIKT
jgi:hypothetical protein